MPSYTLRKLAQGRVVQKVALERLAEPLHLNVAAAGVALAGPFRAKVAFDLVARPQYAYGLLKAADFAASYGLDAITAVEFGVASGAGLLNLAGIAPRVTKATGVRVDVVGFDTGTGMPAARDWRDHPDLYQSGDFPMDQQALRRTLPLHAELVVGELSDTVPAFLEEGRTPLAFAAIDVDYYWSAVDALSVFDGPPEAYSPLGVIYLDDVALLRHNQAAGELLAVREWNDRQTRRRIEDSPFLRRQRVFQRAAWLDQMRLFHVMDHPARSSSALGAKVQRHISNPYLSTGRDRFA